MLYCSSSSTSLCLFVLLSILPFCGIKVDISVSASDLLLVCPVSLFIITRTCFIPPSKYLVRLSIPLAFSVQSLLLSMQLYYIPSNLSQNFSLYCLRVYLFPYSYRLFTSSSHHFTALVNFFPIALLAVVLTSCSHVSNCPIYFIFLCCTLYFQHIGKLLCIFGHHFFLELFSF